MTRKAMGALDAAVCAAAVALLISSGAGAQERTETPVNKEKTLAVNAAPTPAAQLPPAPKTGEMTFVFSNFTIPLYPGWDTCPKGWGVTNREQYLDSVPKAEQTQLLRPENEVELTDKWKAHSAPSGKNVCTNYNEFPDRPIQTVVENKVAYGLNLDGDPADAAKDSYMCAHTTFESPLGEAGVDNQAYRALGCNRIYRGPDGGDGEIIPGYKTHVATGEFTVVMILRGVDSLTNDSSVDVILASSDQQPIIDVSQNVLPGASFHITDNPKWRNELRGRIVDGVLMTETKDIILERGNAYGGNVWDLQRAKMRLAFRPDGTLEGLLGAYEPLLDLIRPMVRGGRGTAHTAGIDCASLWNTLNAMADGGRDPKTGQCNRVSNAYLITAAPAFVFDRPPENTKTAAVQ